MKGAYYNENDPFAAAWLRELIAAGHIAPGEVDDRSIEDVNPDDLDGYSQHHFFAGIGVWSLALRNAGWPDDRAIWTASCPCQPFSAAGKGGGFDDERHLWPALHWLIGQCRPQHVIGEQVASKDGLAWLDLVFADMEAAQYAVGAVDTCAAGFGAPHIRQRSFWAARRLAYADGGHAGAERQQRGGEQRQLAQDGGIGRMAHAQDQRHERTGPAWGWRNGLADDRDALRPGPTNGLWRAADWLGCTDGKWRPVEPGTFPLAHAGAYRNRVAELRGAGNAINVAQAQGFIEAFAESLAA